MNRRHFTTQAGSAAAIAVALNGTGPCQAAAALVIPPGGKLAFNVLHNGTPIGTHRLDFTQEGETLSVAINIALRVTIAGITVFTYALQAQELWTGGVFQSLHSKVDNNGTSLEVHAAKCAAGYNIEGTNVPPYIGPPNTMPLTYWNSQMLNAMILNIQTAHSYPAKVSPGGWNRLPAADGELILAQRYDVTGKLNLSVWYDQQDVWSGLAFHLHGDESYQKIIT